MKTRLFAVAAMITCLFATTASADLLTDGDFEDNPTTAWTTFGNAFLDGEVIGDLDQAAGFSGAESAKTFG
ncbi:MAG: hypothetical protein AAF456_22775, partial [Planctomycetota bacterium]